jgi:hypothetical protein
MPDHIYTDLDTSFKHFREPGRRLHRKVNGKIVDESELGDLVEDLGDIAIPEEVSDALRIPTSSLSVTEQNDYWSMPNLATLVRTHVNPRSEFFAPTTESCAIPLEWVDIFRKTETSLGYGQLREIGGYWTVDARDKPRVLDEEWTGRSFVQTVPTQPPLGKQWQEGRLTVLQPTTRPPNVWVVSWRLLTPKRQQEAVDAWKNLKPQGGKPSTEPRTKYKRFQCQEIRSALY